MSYKYYLRPGYGSSNLLIEFVSGVESQHFVDDLFKAIKELNPKTEEIKDLWMNDEVLIEVNCALGKLDLSIDAWDFAFLMSDDNQECVIGIEAILRSSEGFEKIEAESHKSPFRSKSSDSK